MPDPRRCHVSGLSLESIAVTGLIVASLAALLTMLVSAAFPLPDRLLLDFTQYYDGGRALLSGASPYQPEARLNSPAPFLLPPIFAMAIAPLVVLPVQAANIVWFTLSLACVIASSLCVVELLGAPRSLAKARWQAGLVALLLTFLLLPVWTGVKLGQISPLLFCLSFAGLALRQNGRPLLGGVLVGVASAFKFIPLAIAVLGFWIGWRRFATAAVATFALLQALSAVVYPAVFVEYWTSVIFTIPAHAGAVNLSLIGMLGRLDDEPLSAWRVVASVLSLTMLAAPFALTLGRRANDQERQTLALALLIAAMVTAAPLVEHHYMLALLYPIWLLLCIHSWTGSRRDLVMLGAAFLLLSQPYRLARFVLWLVAGGGDSEALGEALLTGGALLVYVLVLVAAVGHRRGIAEAIPALPLGGRDE
jgi:hypothetical protein